MSERAIVGAVEIGTAKVVVAIGEIVEGPSLSIIGIGEAASQGVKKGEVVDFEAASMAVQAAVMAAEQSAEVNLHSIYLAQTGAHLDAFYNEGSVTVSASDNRVSQGDIERAVVDAKSKDLREERVYIHHIQNPFKLDGRVVGSPLGMEGDRLQVGYWSVHGELKRIRDSIQIINGLGLKVEDMIISSIASGSMVATDTEKQNGVLTVDIGRGTTDFALYSGGYLVHTGVVPVGGDHITNDLSLGLRVSHTEAERLKTEYASVERDVIGVEEDKIWLEGEGLIGKRAISREGIGQVVRARVEELFHVIVAEVEERLPLGEIALSGILTGGSSRLPGVEGLASEVMGFEVRLGENPPWASQRLQNPEYSTILGLLHYALKNKEADASIRVKKGGGLFKKVAAILNLS